MWNTWLRCPYLILEEWGRYVFFFFDGPEDMYFLENTLVVMQVVDGVAYDWNAWLQESHVINETWWWYVFFAIEMNDHKRLRVVFNSWELHKINCM